MSRHEGRHELHRNRGESQHRSRVVFALLAAILIGGLGVAIVTQVKSTESGDSLDTASPADLLVVLDTLNQREAALRQEIASLEQTLTTLQHSGNSEAALDEAQARLTALSIQVGSAPATGPGVTMSITDPNKGVGSEVLLDLVQELRAAGVEAMQIQGAGTPPIRIGVDSWVSGSPGDVSVDGRRVNAPYTVLAIGDPPTLAAALNIPGGVVDTVARSSGQLKIEQSQQVTISALRESKPRQYARPEN
ncbi:DUF881 domain-containing protein [Rhodococcus sp. WMMA185]|uniref:DUF881 domain-containing protein n=1 Tax=Rhodococcus sp. WMMA185 TaxID=679318 RepID=UPI000A062E5A|nr:DUF881 domain-containing protein [Rhodococcus sp. WMMA185]